jgi:peptidoglycan/xylan/chitin deacetylase (PgdA/CDA1 family)
VALPPILCYHKIDTRLELGVTRLGPRHFRRQVEMLARLGFRALGAQELLDAASSPPSTVDRRRSTVVITFDDGYAALAEHAFPVLADHGMRALVFVVTDFVGRANTWDVQYGWRSFAHLDWDALGRWQERGIEVHAHGASHARMTWLSDARAREELERSREAIRARLGSVPLGIAYPFGAADGRVRSLAAQAGYRLGFAGAGASDINDPLLLPRLSVYPWDLAGVPFVMQPGALGALARWGARTTNRIAVGTAAFQRMAGKTY